MNVFPEDMNRINYDDPKQALKQIENYIRYIVERVQFSTNGLLKTVSTSMTTAEVVQQLTALQTTVAAAVSTVNSYSGRINTLENNTAGLSDLEDEVENQRQELSDALDAIDLIQADVEDLQDAAPQTGSTAPTELTEGTVGQLYIDTVTGKVYIMLSESLGEYTWQEISLVEPEPEPEP